MPLCFQESALFSLFPKYPLFPLSKFPQNLRLQCPKPTAKSLPLMASRSSISNEVLPPALDSSSEPPSIFDGTPKFVIGVILDVGVYCILFVEGCTYLTHAHMHNVHGLRETVRLYTEPIRDKQGLQDKIKLVPIDLKNRPAWYKEKVYPANKVPALEHNNEVKGESLDLVKYIDSNFEGPSLFPDDPAKRGFSEELLSYLDIFYKTVTSYFKGEEKDVGDAFDSIETALSKYGDGPFFLCQFSLVDIAYAPFIERFELFLLEVKNYSITTGRPKLAAWIEEMNQIEGYRVTKTDPKKLVESYKKRYLL